MRMQIDEEMHLPSRDWDTRPESRSGRASSRLLFPNTSTRRILSVYRTNPWVELGARDIAELAGRMTPSVAHRSITRLADYGILSKSEQAIPTAWPRYTLNMDSPTTMKLLEALEVDHRLEFLRRKRALVRPLRRLENELLRSTSFSLLGMYLFGSWARNEEGSESDLDLLLVFPPGCMPQRDEIRAAERDLRATLNPSLIPVDPVQVRDGFAQHKPVYEDIWRDRVILSGESLFWQLIRSIPQSQGGGLG